MAISHVSASKVDGPKERLSKQRFKKKEII